MKPDHDLGELQAQSQKAFPTSPSLGFHFSGKSYGRSQGRSTRTGEEREALRKIRGTDDLWKR